VTANISFTLVSLGCPKNRVDSERILAAMMKGGFVYQEEPAGAEVIIVNTCAFIEPAVEESVNTILDLSAENPDAFIVAAGCLPLRYKEELEKAMTEVHLFLSPERIADLPRILTAAFESQAPKRGKTRKCAASTPRDRVLSTPGYAYLRIAEGCSRGCRYCTIPLIRGAFRSEDLSHLQEEAESLASRGVRELVLVAQDLTGYGTDRREKGALVRLLRCLESIDGIQWIRLMYLHPNGIPRDLPGFMKASAKVLPYLDIPFQHISDRVLRAMGRPWKGDRIRSLVDRLRSSIPGLVLRTTLMVGFPAEGDSEFDELKDFVEQTRIEHVGVFTYSPEEGTRAQRLGDPVPEDLKQARADEIRELHARFIRTRNRARIGTVEPALIEGVSEESELLLQGRTRDQAPEVDGVLYVTAGEARAWDIQPVRITGAHGPDLFGEIVDTGTRSTLV